MREQVDDMIGTSRSANTEAAELTQHVLAGNITFLCHDNTHICGSLNFRAPEAELSRAPVIQTSP